MKTLYIVGDSISMQYGPFLQNLLPPDWRLSRKKDKDNEAWNDPDIPAGENNGDSRMALAYLRGLRDADWDIPDILLLNCGLHDIKRCNGIYQIALNLYEQNLRDIFSLLQQQKIPVIWVSSTPVDDAIHNSRQPEFQRYNADLVAYNSAAANIAREKGIPIIDLYEATLPFLPLGLYDHVHYTEEVQRMQAAFIFDHIREKLKA